MIKFIQDKKIIGWLASYKLDLIIHITYDLNQFGLHWLTNYKFD